MTAVAAPAAPTTHVDRHRDADADANADADASALLSFLLPEVEEQRVSDLLVEEINKGPGSGLEIPDHPPSLSSSFLKEHNDIDDMDPLQVIENPLNLSPLHKSDLSSSQFPPSPHSSDPQEQEQDLDENDLDDIIKSLERDNILLTPPITPASATSLGVDFLPFVPMINEPGLSPYRKMSAPNPLLHYHSNCSIFITPTFRANGGKAFGHKRKRSDFKAHAERSSSDTVLVLPPTRRRKSDDQGTLHRDTEKEIDALFEEPESLVLEEKDSAIIDIYDGLSDCSDETDETVSLQDEVAVSAVSERADTATL